ncbi:hypothetical protein E4U48_000207 [Claviceps purpurea]|nr:hypothetical protein E4U27_000290 [Claviceps purpurea]KAG6175778.1 hypothetical protein E4U36_000179 [Claviceps purpurea]KAG6221988.1 hypothetical protein E4U25_000616 [Claviceps purpurea]KAG6260045.1 hypothetical protein E4U48_000207 [Claviceps purpurea]
MAGNFTIYAVLNLPEQAGLPPDQAPQDRQKQPPPKPQSQFKLHAKITGLERTGKKDPVLRFEVHITYLLEALEAQEKDVLYFALDVSAPQLTATLKEIPSSNFRHVRFAGLYGTFEDGLRWINETPEIRDLPHCVLLLGLTIGNFSRKNAARLLQNIVNHALTGASKNKSSILLSLDSCKVPTKVTRAYTSDGVVPFALQALTYAKTLLCGRVDNGIDKTALSCNLRPDDWHYLSEWNFALGRHEASLIPRFGDVCLESMLQDIVVKKDEKVRFACSYKYDAKERQKLFLDSGVDQGMVWTNECCDVAIDELKLA